MIRPVKDVINKHSLNLSEVTTLYKIVLFRSVAAPAVPGAPAEVIGLTERSEV